MNVVLTMARRRGRRSARRRFIYSSVEKNRSVVQAESIFPSQVARLLLAEKRSAHMQGDSCGHKTLPLN